MRLIEGSQVLTVQLPLVKERVVSGFNARSVHSVGSNVANSIRFASLLDFLLLVFTFSSWMRRYWFYVKNDFRNFHQIFTF